MRYGLCNNDDLNSQIVHKRGSYDTRIVLSLGRNLTHRTPERVLYGARGFHEARIV